VNLDCFGFIAKLKKIELGNFSLLYTHCVVRITNTRKSPKFNFDKESAKFVWLAPFIRAGVNKRGARLETLFAGPHSVTCVEILRVNDDRNRSLMIEIGLC